MGIRVEGLLGCEAKGSMGLQFFRFSAAGLGFRV